MAAKTSVVELPVTETTAPQPPQSIESTTNAIALAVEAVDDGGVSFPIVYLSLSSLVVLLSGVRALESGMGAYAVSVGAVSLTLTLALAVLLHLCTDCLERLTPGPKRVTVLQALAGFLTMWWLAGACVMTFHGPFVNTSNGYFSSWGGLVSAAMLLGRASLSSGNKAADVYHALTHPSKGARGLLCACALVLLLSCLRHAEDPEGAFGLACGGATLVVVVLFSLILECRSNARLRRGGAALLLLLWLVAATLLTFLGPFTTTGNGFFACWGGLLCAFAFTWHEGGLGAAEPPPAAPARARSNSITAAAAAAASKIAAAGPQRLQLVCLGSASVVVLASAVPAAGVGDGLGDYALCVGAVSLCAVGFVLGALRACAPLLDQRNKGPQRLTLRQWLAGFLVIWWLVAACVLTFLGPFTATSNGYAASWGGLLGSCYFARTSWADRMGTKMTKAAEALRRPSGGARGMLAVCAAVLLLASLPHLASLEGLWALAASAFTLLLLAALATCTICCEGRLRSSSLLLLAVWVCVAGVLTFTRPFAVTGNGFFACWAGLLCAFAFAWEEF